MSQDPQQPDQRPDDIPPAPTPGPQGGYPSFSDQQQPGPAPSTPPYQAAASGTGDPSSYQPPAGSAFQPPQALADSAFRPTQGLGAAFQAPAPGEPTFLQALFDTSFSNFITIKFARVIYLIGIGLIAIGWLVAVISGFTQGFGMGLAFLILGAVVALFYIVIFRLTLEFYVAMVRTAQNTSILVDRHP